MGEYLSGLYNSVYKYSPYADQPLLLEGDPLAQSETIRAEQERWLGDMRNSVSFRIGRAISWASRKVRGDVRCLQDHVAAYTLRRALYHVGLRKDEEKSKGACAIG